jgi:hypothetical protein
MLKKRVPFTPDDLDHRQQGTDDILTGDPTKNILIGDAGGSMFDFSSTTSASAKTIKSCLAVWQASSRSMISLSPKVEPVPSLLQELIK